MAKKVMKESYGTTEAAMNAAYKIADKAGTLGIGFGGPAPKKVAQKVVQKIAKPAFNAKKYNNAKKKVFGI